MRLEQKFYQTRVKSNEVRFSKTHFHEAQLAILRSFRLHETIDYHKLKFTANCRLLTARAYYVINNE